MGVPNIELLSQYSQYTQALHRAAQRLPTDVFQQWALTEWQALCPFDAAWWGRATYPEHQPQTPQVLAQTPFKLPDAYCQEWQHIRSEDRIAQRLFANPKKSVRLCTRSDALHPEFRDFLLRHRIEKSLCFMVRDPLLSLDDKGALRQIHLVNFLSLYRFDSNSGFSDEEAALLQIALPHLADALNTSHTHTLQKERHAQHAEDASLMAIADLSGTIHHREAGFIQAAKKHWLCKNHLQLKTEFCPAISQARVHWCHQGQTLDITRLGAQLMLTLGTLSPLSALSPTEHEVVQRYAAGATYRQIADQLHRSPATIRNQIQSAYLKLGIQNKAALVALCHRDS